MRASWQHAIQLIIIALLWFSLLAAVMTCAGREIGELLAPR